MKTYLEYKDDKSQKFWEITLEGKSFTTRYGKIGSDGTSKTKVFDTEEKAQKEVEKLISHKKKKGYADEEAIEENSIVTDVSHLIDKYPIIEEALDIVDYNEYKLYKDLSKLPTSLNDGQFIVIGDVKAENLYIDKSAFLIVTGNVEAKNIHVCDGNLFVGGDIKVINILLTNGQGHGVSNVLGDSEVAVWLNFNYDLGYDFITKVYMDGIDDEDSENTLQTFKELKIDSENKDKIRWQDISKVIDSGKSDDLANYLLKNFSEDIITENEIPSSIEFLYQPKNKIFPNLLFHEANALDSENITLIRGNNLFSHNIDNIHLSSIRMPKKFQIYKVLTSTFGIFVLGKMGNKISIAQFKDKAFKQMQSIEGKNIKSAVFYKTKTDVFIVLNQCIYRFIENQWQEIINNSSFNFENVQTIEYNKQTVLITSKGKLLVLTQSKDKFSIENFRIDFLEETTTLKTIIKHKNTDYFIKDNELFYREKGKTNTVTTVTSTFIPEFIEFKNQVYLFDKDPQVYREDAHGIYKIENGKIEAVFTDCTIEPRAIKMIYATKKHLIIVTAFSIYTYNGRKWEMKEFGIHFKNEISKKDRDNYKNFG